MTIYKIKNLDVLPANVRIYKVNASSTIQPSDQFTALDPIGASYGISLTPIPLNCVGSIDYAGLLEFTDMAGSMLVTGDGTGIAITEDTNILEVFSNLGLVAVELTAYIPAQS